MYIFNDKAANINTSNQIMLAKTGMMFEYEGLPETIPKRELERILQTNGFAFITEVEGELYAFAGGLGGEPDVYGRPTKIVISNPALKFFKELDLKEDGVLIENDDARMGLMPILDRYNTLLSENDVTRVVVSYGSRITSLIAAADDKTKLSAELFLKKVVAGEMGVIGEQALFDGVKVHQGSGWTAALLTALLEDAQYTKSNLYTELGMPSAYNMKRERLNEAEIGLSEDSLVAFPDNMMSCRLRGIEALNEKYELDVRVDFGSVWAVKHKELVDDVIGNEPTAPEQGPLADPDSDSPADADLRSPADSEPSALEPETEQELPAQVTVNIEVNTDGEVADDSSDDAADLDDRDDTDRTDSDEQLEDEDDERN